MVKRGATASVEPDASAKASKTNPPIMTWGIFKHDRAWSTADGKDVTCREYQLRHTPNDKDAFRVASLDILTDLVAKSSNTSTPTKGLSAVKNTKSVGWLLRDLPIGFFGAKSFVVKTNHLFETHHGDATRVIKELNELTCGAIDHKLSLPQGSRPYTITAKVEAYDAAAKASEGLMAWSQLTDGMPNEQDDDTLSLIVTGYHLDKIIQTMTHGGSLQTPDLAEYALSRSSSTVYAGIIDKSGLESNINVLKANFAKAFRRADLVHLDVDMESVSRHK